MKNVQIPEELFARICSYFILDRREPLQEEIIKQELLDKLERMQAREDYASKLTDR